MDFTTTIGNDLNLAKTILQQGGLIGLPTETVYGLAGNALNADTVLNIFSVKNRPYFDPLIVHVAAVEQVEEYAAEVPPKARLLLQHFTPGPLTLLLKKKPVIPDLVTSGLDTVAIRIPGHEMTRQLLAQLPFPLAAPSANPFGYISPTSARHVFDQLQGKIEYILDGGPTTVGVESTILGFEGDEIVVYRLGGLPLEEIEAVAGEIKIPSEKNINPAAPGMLKSHYAPRKKLVFANAALLPPQARIAVIAFNKYVPGFPEMQQTLLSAAGDLQEAAKNLFAVMRQLDAGDADVIFAVEFPDTGLGRAINDRLQRAGA